MKSIYSLRKSIYLLFCFTAIFYFAGHANGQIPSTFKNLQVLNKNISKSEIIEKMKAISISLGVRCEFCHVGNPEEGFKSFDFSSDEKEPKKIARIMMIMVDDINQTHLRKLSDSSKKVIENVNCYTCHHGNNKPRLLKTEIENALFEGGLDSAVTKYHELKNKYLGASVYDFSENSLNLIAMDLAEINQIDNAIGLLKLNEEQYPESVSVKEMLVNIYLKSERIQEAIETCKKILELVPDNKRIQNILKRLQDKSE